MALSRAPIIRKFFGWRCPLLDIYYDVFHMMARCQMLCQFCVCVSRFYRFLFLMRISQFIAVDPGPDARTKRNVHEPNAVSRIETTTGINWWDGHELIDSAFFRNSQNRHKRGQTVWNHFRFFLKLSVEQHFLGKNNRRQKMEIWSLLWFCGVRNLFSVFRRNSVFYIYLLRHSDCILSLSAIVGARKRSSLRIGNGVAETF